MAVLLQFLQSGLYLVGNALATKLNAIVSEAARVALGYKNINVRISLPNAGSEVLEMFRVAPEAVGCEPTTPS